MLSKQQQREILGKKVEALLQQNCISGNSVSGKLAVVPKWLNPKISIAKQMSIEKARRCAYGEKRT